MGPIAKDSPFVEKAKIRLQKIIAEEESKINPAAIKKTIEAIKNSISRNSQDRKSLKGKEFTPSFDKNQKPATAKSRYVSKLLNQLKENSKTGGLEGRVTR